MKSARPALLNRAALLPLLLIALTHASAQAPGGYAFRPGNRLCSPAPQHEDTATTSADGRLFGQTRADYAARRAALRAAARDGILLLCGPIEEEDIDRIRFRTANDILYLTGVEASGTTLALLPSNDPTSKREILFLPTQSRTQKIFDDPVPGPDPDTEKRTGIASVQPLSALWDTLTPSLKKAQIVYVLGPTGERSHYTPGAALEAKLKALHPNLILRSADNLIHNLRWRKSPSEIANLRIAIAATGAAERNAARAIRPDVSEMTIEGVLLAAFRAGGAPREGFPCIVGSGPNSTILHHFAGERRMKAGETIVVDIGAEVNYYSADITRTFPCGGTFTPRQRELYQLVLDTQRACEQYVKPGKTTLQELHAFAVKFLRNSPLRARDRDGVERTMDAFFPHGLGHWLGMDVHDVWSDSMVLEPGVVFTIEPGVYVPREGIGIRIEDDYLVTPDGLEKLSKEIPSEASQIEALMRTTTP